MTLSVTRAQEYATCCDFCSGRSDLKEKLHTLSLMNIISVDKFFWGDYGSFKITDNDMSPI